MKRPSVLILTAALTVFHAPAQPPKASTTVHSQPLHAGKIDPKLFGNFIELLDDVAPGMWAEMLNDRSFEGIIPAARWCYYDGSPDICDRAWDTNATWTIDTVNPFNGTRAARLSAGAQPARLTQSGLVARKGLGYTCAGYLRGEPGVKVTVALKCLLPTGDWMVLGSAELPAVSAAWQRYAVVMNSRGETDRAVFELRAEGSGQVWADKLSLMPEDQMKGWRREVVEVTKAVRPAVMRWGGSSVDPGHYRWKDGIGDRDRRAPWRNEIWGRLDSNDVGIDEFCQFCELTACEPLICVSLADGPESAADLVEYCNGEAGSGWGAKRAAHGHLAPYHVKYWQIGNEINPGSQGYLAQFPKFIAQMRHVDPGVRIMTSYPSQELLDQVGKDIAYVCPHHYTTDFAACDREFNQVTEMLSRTPGCAGVRLAVTEWNIDGGSWGLGRGKQPTLWAALMNARYLHVMMRHSDKVEMACRSNLANSYCGAIIETAPGGFGVLKRASYYAMHLYSHHAQPIPLRVDYEGVPIDVFACGAEDHKSITLFVVNLRPEPIELSLGLTDFPGGVRAVHAEGLCDTLDARQPDVMNHWNAPDRLRLMNLPATAEAVKVPSLSAVAIDFDLN